MWQQLAPAREIIGRAYLRSLPPLGNCAPYTAITERSYDLRWTFRIVVWSAAGKASVSGPTNRLVERWRTKFGEQIIRGCFQRDYRVVVIKVVIETRRVLGTVVLINGISKLPRKLLKTTHSKTFIVLGMMLGMVKKELWSNTKIL